MLAILKNEDNIKKRQEKWQEKEQNNDIIVIQKEKISTYDDDGNEIIKTQSKKINITRKINETAKLLNQLNTEQRLKKLEEALEKE